MNNFNEKGTKCPTLWQGTDSLVQNQAMSEELAYTPRPDYSNDTSETEEKTTDSEDCNALGNLLGNLIGLFTTVTLKDWLHTG
ncbi:MAG: hypothetical protein MUC49_05985 [Raineya sp.]|nr:hypothetical protein [Raineya sp.]